MKTCAGIQPGSKFASQTKTHLEKSSGKLRWAKMSEIKTLKENYRR